jgi:hypothetical protein
MSRPRKDGLISPHSGFAMTCGEVAAELGISKHSVASIEYRAIRKLRKNGLYRDLLRIIAAHEEERRARTRTIEVRS